MFIWSPSYSCPDLVPNDTFHRNVTQKILGELRVGECVINMSMHLIEILEIKSQIVNKETIVQLHVCKYLYYFCSLIRANYRRSTLSRHYSAAADVPSRHWSSRTSVVAAEGSGGARGIRGLQYQTRLQELRRHKAMGRGAPVANGGSR